ncbi:hypothetical protein GCM10027343_02650 [Noviherbaspirillum agri]
MKTLIAIVLVSVMGVAAGWDLTAGFRAFTTEDARRLSIAERPLALPDAMLEHADGRTVSLATSLREDTRATIMVFFYARCNSVCSVLGSQFQQLQDAIRARGLHTRIRLLAISFDHRDDLGALQEYAQRMHADQTIWQVARFTNDAERDRLLAASGITVIPAPLGEFEHNAAFHIVSPEGRLMRIVDYDQLEDALAHALAVLPGAVDGDGGAM